MIESVLITIFPLLFLILLFGGGKLLLNKGIDMGGKPPIHRTIFALSKYAIVLLWVCVVAQTWGLNLSMFKLSSPITYVSLILWFGGFLLLYIGRFGLGSSFRIGQPGEKTKLKMNGLFRFSRNPMYVGVYATVLASILYTANVIVLLIGIFIIVVHHHIILAEEKYLQKTFGRNYHEYCSRVRRYI
jgi:protein-S-isoprenylcysteine O-methyltransferase Ste14